MSADEKGDCLDCREVFLRIDDYIDRALSKAEVEQVNAHLDECSPCAKELGFTSSMVEQIRAKLTRVQAPEQLRTRLAELLSAAEG
ncbi:MAG: zf-HC2 domain-containing protein [Longimicrobiales bacterium]